MRKLLFILTVLLSFLCTVNAQVRLQADGKVGIHTLNSIHADDDVLFWGEQFLLGAGGMHVTVSGYQTTFSAPVFKHINFYDKDAAKSMDVYASAYYKKSDSGSNPVAVASLDNPLAVLRDIDGVTYNFKDETSKKSSSAKLYNGFIAQDIEKVLPNSVHTDERGYKSIDYSELLPILVEAVKVLSEKAKQQEVYIQELEASLSTVMDDDTKKKAEELLTARLEEANTETNFVEIAYYIPKNAESVQLIIYNETGTQVLARKINDKGEGSERIKKSTLKNGRYHYSLLVDQIEIASLQITIDH